MTAAWQAVQSAVQSNDLQALEQASDFALRTAAQRRCLITDALSTNSFDAALWLLTKRDELDDDSVTAGYTHAHVYAARGDIDALQGLTLEQLRARGGLNNESVLHVAARAAQVDALELLLRELEEDLGDLLRDEDGATPLHVASGEGHVEVLEALVRHGVGVDNVDMFGSSAWLEAATMGRAEAMRCLLRLGCDPRVFDVRGRGAMHCAVMSSNKEAVDVLADCGLLDVGVDGDGASPLHKAAVLVLPEMIAHLVQLGTDVDIQDAQGMTALCHAASMPGGEAAVVVLIDAGADRWVRDGDGRTARDIAEESGQEASVQLLEEYWPMSPAVVQVLLGLRGPTESPLTRLAGHVLFEPQVLGLVKCLLTGEERAAFRVLVG